VNSALKTEELSPRRGNISRIWHVQHSYPSTSQHEVVWKWPLGKCKLSVALLRTVYCAFTWVRVILNDSLGPKETCGPAHLHNCHLLAFQQSACPAKLWIAEENWDGVDKASELVISGQNVFMPGPVARNAVHQRLNPMILLLPQIVLMLTMQQQHVCHQLSWI